VENDIKVKIKNENILPLVSICIPAYNHKEYVAETIQSAIDQTYENIELIIINDGSKDDTGEIIENFYEACKLRFKNFIYINRENKGLTKTLNEMIDLSSGDFLKFIASDDRLFPTAIDDLLGAFNSLDIEYGLVCGNVSFIDNYGKPFYPSYNEKTILLTFKNCIDIYGEKYLFNFEKDFGKYDMLVKFNHISAQGNMIRKSSILAVGKFQENLRLEDVDLWLKLSKLFKMKFFDSIVAEYRYHDLNSIKLDKLGLMVDRVTLLFREKKYCNMQGFNLSWNSRFVVLYKEAIANKQWLLAIKMLRAVNFDIGKSIAMHIFKRIFK